MSLCYDIWMGLFSEYLKDPRSKDGAVTWEGSRGITIVGGAAFGVFTLVLGSFFYTYEPPVEFFNKLDPWTMLLFSATKPLVWFSGICALYLIGKREVMVLSNSPEKAITLKKMWFGIRVHIIYSKHKM